MTLGRSPMGSPGSPMTLRRFPTGGWGSPMTIRLSAMVTRGSPMGIRRSMTTQLCVKLLLSQPLQDRLGASNVLPRRVDVLVELLPPPFKLGVVQPFLDDICNPGRNRRLNAACHVTRHANRDPFDDIT